MSGKTGDNSSNNSFNFNNNSTVTQKW
jgi:hypothetical protein